MNCRSIIDFAAKAGNDVVIRNNVILSTLYNNKTLDKIEYSTICELLCS